MSDLVYQGATSAEYLQISSLLQSDIDNPYPKDIEISASPKTVVKTTQYGTSLLLAYGSSNLSGRTYLIVKNRGDVMARIGSSSNAAIYEEGIPIEPGETKVFKASAEISLYARAMGYATELEITEV